MTDHEEYEEEDDSWYEEAMNQLESPLHNHDTIYSEDEVFEMSEIDKTIIRKRNDLLANGYEFTEIQIGDYMQKIINRSAVIHAASSNFMLMYRREKDYAVISQQSSGEDEEEFPIQITALIHTDKNLGCYQFMEFIQTHEQAEGEEELNFNGIEINQTLTYQNKPSLEFSAADNISYNVGLIEKIQNIAPIMFEFINNYVVIEIEDGNSEKFNSLSESIGSNQ